MHLLAKFPGYGVCVVSRKNVCDMETKEFEVVYPFDLVYTVDGGYRWRSVQPLAPYITIIAKLNSMAMLFFKQHEVTFLCHKYAWVNKS